MIRHEILLAGREKIKHPRVHRVHHLAGPALKMFHDVSPCVSPRKRATANRDYIRPDIAPVLLSEEFTSPADAASPFVDVVPVELRDGAFHLYPPREQQHPNLVAGIQLSTLRVDATPPATSSTFLTVCFEMCLARHISLCYMSLSTSPSASLTPAFPRSVA